MSAYLPRTAPLRTLMITVDVAGLAVAGWIAFRLRFASGALAAKQRELLDGPGLILWGAVAAVLLAAAAELYEPELLHRRREVVVRALVVVTGWSLAMVVATYLRPEWTYGRGLLAIHACGWTLFLVGGRWSLRWWRHRRRARFPALVIGEDAAVATFCTELAQRPSALWRPIDGSALELDDIPAAVARDEATMVILTGGDERAREMGHDLARLHFSGVPVVTSSEIWAFLEERLPLAALSPAIFLHQPGFGAVHWTLFNRLTRIADIVLASLLLVIAAPILLLSALAVIASSGRPVLYRQERVGQFGRRFTMLKLRTMRRDAEDAGPEFASEDDPRITAVGGVLRRFRLDELPQLWNVLKGEMSLVGPRPERPEFIDRLTARIPYYAFRLAVPPGITGWAQVNTAYARDLDDHRRKLEFDLYFIRERSTRLYLLTLLRTVSAALVGVRR